MEDRRGMIEMKNTEKKQLTHTNMHTHTHTQNERPDQMAEGLLG